MSGVIIAAIISALVAAGSGIASYINTKKTNEQNQQNYEDWKSYNTSANQMSRYLDAGLNPYLAGSMSSTLSQPFQVGTNNGIAEALSGVANVATGATQYAGQAYQKELDRQLQRDNLKIQERRNDLNMLGLRIRERLAENAIKQGDYRAALLATQGSIAELNRQYLSTTLPYRTQSSFYDSLYKQLYYNYNKEMFSKNLQFYDPMKRAIINNYLARTNHLRWYEEFAKWQFMKSYNQRERLHSADRSDKYFFYSTPSAYENMRYDLSRDYYDLARDKFHWNMFSDMFFNLFR